MSDINSNRPSHTVERSWVEGPEFLGRPRLHIRSEDADAVRDAWKNIGDTQLGADATRALLAELQGQVTAGTLHAIRAQMLSSGTSLLAHAARSGRARIVLSFAGQAQTYFEDLERLYEVPSARRVIEACAEAVADELAQGARLEGLHPYGIDLISWLNDPTTRPPQSVLANGVTSQPLIFI